MKDDVRRVRSLHVLQRLLAPLVALHISRVRQRKAAMQNTRQPDADALKVLPLFAKWPTATLQNWIAGGAVEVHEKGTTIAFAGEPRRAADVFWLISGKLAQVPNKAELRLCAGDLVHLPQNVPKTGPLILPSHFMEGSAKKSLPPLTAAQEHLADALSFYHVGQVVDGERLLLGGARLRALRCQTDVVVVRLSFAACLRELQTLPGAIRSATIDVARQYVQRTLAQFFGAPSTPSIMASNPVLAALPLTVLKTIRLQLKPYVFLNAEIICDNVFAAEWMYFLESGQVRVEDSNGAYARTEAAPLKVIGMNSFVQCRMPDHFGQRSRAVAATYCETWGVPIAAVLSACDGAARLRCALAASEQLRAHGVGRLPIATVLRACACFADLSEQAVVAIARALQLRVYTADEVILPAGRIPAFGVIVVAGDVQKLRSTSRDTQQLSPGQALYFSESLVKMCVADAVKARSSAVVLHGSPALLLEVIEAAGLAAGDVPVLLRSAQAYVDRHYGAGLSEISKAQYAAAERVRAYKRRQAEEMSSDRAAASPHAATANDVLRNELLASLEVQLHTLHPDDDDAAKFAYFHAGQAVADVKHDADTCSAHPLPPPPPQRRSSYFSLDAQGSLITCDDSSSSAGNAAPLPQQQHQSGPPDGATNPRQSASPPLLPSPPFDSRFKAKITAVLPRRKPAAATTTTPATAAFLRTPVRAPAQGAKLQQTKVSPRISALRAAATRLKDEADGVDRRKERRSYLAHHPPR